MESPGGRLSISNPVEATVTDRSRSVTSRSFTTITRLGVTGAHPHAIRHMARCLNTLMVPPEQEGGPTAPPIEVLRPPPPTGGGVRGEGLSERLLPGDRLPQDQRVHVVGPLVGVHRLEVRHVPHRVVFHQDAV